MIIIIQQTLITAVIYWTKASKATLELKIVSFVFSLLGIPIFSTFYSKYFPNNTFDIFYTQQYIEPYEMGIDYYNFYAFWNIDRNFEPSEEIDEMYLKAHILSAEEERYEEAIEIYCQIIDKTPPNAFMYYRLAKCYNYVEQFDLAISALDLAIKLDPRNTEYYNLRGNIYSQLNNADLALKDFKKSLKLNPTDAKTYLYLTGLYYYLYKDYLKAHEAIEKVELYDAELVKDFLPLKQEIEEQLAQQDSTKK